MKRLIFILIFLSTLINPTPVKAGCPVEFIQGTLAPVIFSFERRDGTGEDTTNTGNKRIAFSYWNGSAYRWVGSDNLWDDTSETLLTMTQLTGSQYYYNLPAAALSSTVGGEYITVRFDETDDVDVTVSYSCFVQPEDRLILTELGIISGTADSPASSTTSIVDTTVLTNTGSSDYVGGVVVVDDESRIIETFDPATDKISWTVPLKADADGKGYKIYPNSLYEILNRARRR